MFLKYSSCRSLHRTKDMNDQMVGSDFELKIANYLWKAKVDKKSIY